MNKRHGTDISSPLDADFGDQGTCDGSSEQVDVFVFGLPLQDRVGEITAEFFASIDELGGLGSDIAGLLHDGITIFAGLTEVDIHAMHIVAFILKPSDQDGSIQTTAVRQHYRIRHVSHLQLE